MDGQERQRDAELTPRRDIPDAWAGNGRCPICGADGFSVVHLQGYADYFVCKHCELSFEVEQGGKLVRLKHIPDDYDQVYDKLRFRWVEMSVLRTLALQDRPSLVSQEPQKTEVVSASPPAFTDDEVMERALGMYRLGNQPKMVEMILLQAGARPEQAARAFARLKAMQGQTTRKQSTKLAWLGMAAALTLVLLLAILGGLYVSGWFEVRAQATMAPTPRPPQELLLKEVQKQLPDSAVYNSGPAKSECPGSRADAARLFGGTADDWEHSSQYAWQLTSTAQAVTLKVPAGMTVGYFKNPTLEFTNGYGPLTITNVNFAMITCQ